MTTFNKILNNVIHFKHVPTHWHYHVHPFWYIDTDTLHNTLNHIKYKPMERIWIANYIESIKPSQHFQEYVVNPNIYSKEILFDKIDKTSPYELHHDLLSKWYVKETTKAIINNQNNWCYDELFLHLSFDELFHINHPTLKKDIFIKSHHRMAIHHKFTIKDYILLDKIKKDKQNWKQLISDYYN